MTAYWILFLIVLGIHIIPIKDQKQFNFKLVASFIPLFIFGAFRVDFGRDYNAYLIFFEEIQKFGISERGRIEIGYAVLNYLLPSFRSLLVLQTLLLCITYYYLFKWFIPAKWSWLGVTLLFLSGNYTIFFMLSGIRNSIAISIFILSTPLLFKKRYISFIIMIYLAYLFHTSIVLYVPFAMIAARRKQMTIKELVVWSSVILFFFVSSFTSILIYADLFIKGYFTQYTSYTQKALEISESAGILAKLFTIVIFTFTFLFLRRTELTAKENFIMRLSMLFLIAGFLGPLNIRMSQTFVSFLIPAVVYVANKCNNKPIKYGFLFAIFAYVIYSFFVVWQGNPDFAYDVYHSTLF